MLLEPTLSLYRESPERDHFSPLAPASRLPLSHIEVREGNIVILLRNFFMSPCNLFMSPCKLLCVLMCYYRKQLLLGSSQLLLAW